MPQPNILLIVIDDLGWRDLTCYGSSFYETPHLDRLAGDGMAFSQAYAACPVCSPTRASLLTGKYPARLGLTNFIGGKSRGKLLEVPFIDHMPEGEWTLAQALRAGGYRTYHVGKWHLGREEFWPERRGFEVNLGGCNWGGPHNGYFAPYGLPTLPEGLAGEYLTDRLTDEAIRLIETNGNQPFFLNLWYYAVHIPLQAPDALVKKYQEKARDLGLDRLQTFAEGDFFPCEHKKDKRIIRRLVQSDPVYAAMIENLDENIGRLLTALENCGQAQNTLVIFTSDNGGLSSAEGSPTCNAPLAEGKGWMQEGGTREPLIARWPGVIPAASHCDTPLISPDFYPTLLEAAGLPLLPEQHVDGISFLPLLRGEALPPREAFFWHYPHYSNQGTTPGSVVRVGDYKLIEYFEDGRLELFNLADDLGETRNLARDLPGTTRELRQRLADWRETVCAQIPRPNPDYS